MYLKRIELAGFKSFADRTTIQFENGVTAIVGPNGSGKSNITEALRWVLGEQSAKNLRGGKMPDIIFAGSETRKPLNIAEVTIVLDNSDHYLGLDFSEISVTRRYRRTGESDFFINKQACRLKDIQDLFMDSGLGKESFSIISQGKVEAIFNSKPEERRGIFEEAAGVLKYKVRKRKAEQKLFETEDNLNRVQDIIYELEDQLAPLAEQSRIAARFLALKEELTTVDVGLTVHEIKANQATWERVAAELADLAKELAEIAETIEARESSLLDLRQKRQELNQSMDQIQQQLLQLTEAYKQAEGQQELLSERSKHSALTATEYQQNLAELMAAAEQLKTEMAELKTTSEAQQNRWRSLTATLQELEEQVAFYSRSSKELLEELRSEYVEVMQQQANTSNDLKHLEKQYQQETVKNKQTLQNQAAMETQLQEAKEAAKQSATTVAQQAELLAQQRAAYSEKQQQLKQQQLRFDQEQKQMFQLMNRLQQTKARQTSLQEIQENYTGFYQGVRYVLQHKQKLTGVVGAVAELMEVPTELNLAIETALGGAAQHIVMTDEQAARQAITFLKEQRGGRATFLPLTTIKPRQLSPRLRQQVQQEGFVGVASELVQFSEELTTIVENLLGTTVIATDLAAANRIARASQYQCRVVSLEGDVMNPGGSMTGGANKRQGQGLFSHQQELTRLTAEKEQLEAQLTTQEQQVQQLEKAVKTALHELENDRAAGEEARLQEQKMTAALETAQAEVTRLEKELRLFQYETKELQRFLTEYETQKAELTATKAALETKRQQLDEQMAELDQASTEREAKRSRLQQELAQRQAELAALKEQQSFTESQLQERENRLAENRLNQERLSNQLAALSSTDVDQQLSKEGLAQQLVQLAEKLSAMQATLAAKKADREATQAAVDQLDQQVSADHRRQQERLQVKGQLEVQKNRAELNLDRLLVHLQEEYSLSFEAAEKAELTIAEADARAAVKRLKQSISQLGPVNLNAIEQHQQVEERHEFLTSQRDDLLQAKDQLFATMAEMDEEVKQRFAEVFEAIRGQFKQVFPNMFGGGRAELRLTDPNDLLNTGIEIEAQPPGKKLQSLSLLSGGERALTAIALLFSIIRVRPVPFCVLDEVEAALDEANVSRFGRYLNSFEKDTQFIVVTHRKGTMEAADILYGVTMQESGVSKIVSVRLEEVKEGGRIEAPQGEAL
ncbi:chromosome segregation protein SMC [Enterococcus canis]|uniref:Chromosome partition protein Smc n=1 Tax=Enterococcus canis TaxID=214095 RepID=A0A1L8RGM9_9ENTE|nr:chromosome segregation protein SMC [Enterococcus canis]OJG18852.1 chromosome segregation protein SMC [Enterococcus canis]